MNAQRKFGIVKWFDNKKGFGFIIDGQKTEYFVHYTAIAGHGYRSLAEQTPVTFIVSDDGKGPKAVDVKRHEPSQ